MNSFLILSPNSGFIDDKIKGFIDRLKIPNFDQIVISTQNSLGIADVKYLISASFKKPLSGHRLIVLKNFHLSTVEAQNALLKFLEETGINQTVLLTAQSSENILPTVISRCEIIKDLKREADNSSDQNDKTKIIENIFALSLSGRLAFVQKEIGSKDEAIEFLNQIIDSLEKKLHNTNFLKTITLNNLEIVTIIKKSHMAKKYIDGNLNFKHVIDVLLLGFPQLK